MRVQDRLLEIKTDLENIAPVPWLSQPRITAFKKFEKLFKDDIEPGKYNVNRGIGELNFFVSEALQHLKCEVLENGMELGGILITDKEYKLTEIENYIIIEFIIENDCMVI